MPKLLPQPTNGVIAAPLNASPFAKRVALSRGFQVREATAGMASIGQTARETVRDGGKLFLAYDDGAISGGNLNREGDAVFTAAALALAAQRLKAFGRTLVDQLNLLYGAFGYWTDRHFYMDPAGALPADLTARTLKNLADMPPQDIFGRKIKVLIDYTHGSFWLQPAPLLQYCFADGSQVTVYADTAARRLTCQIHCLSPNHDTARQAAETLAGRLRKALKVAAETAKASHSDKA